MTDAYNGYYHEFADGHNLDLSDEDIEGMKQRFNEDEALVSEVAEFWTEWCEDLCPDISAAHEGEVYDLQIREIKRNNVLTCNRIFIRQAVESPEGQWPEGIVQPNKLHHILTVYDARKLEKAA